MTHHEPQGAEKGIPVILDTDIGTDIDDTWALAMMLNSPELDVKMVTTATFNTTYRAKIAAKILEIAGRTDIPIGIGVHENDDIHGQGPWVEDYDLSRYPGTVHQDGVDALIRTIMDSSEPITLIAIGPLPNVAAALEREPRIAERARFVGMHGSVRRRNDKGEVIREYNVAQDAKAAQKVFTAPWDMTITPLDTCAMVFLQGEKYRRVRDCTRPLAQAVIENYRIWSGGKDPDRSSTLFDTVAIYLAFTDDLLTMERLPIRIMDDGLMVEEDRAKIASYATEWKDLSAFEDLVVERITG